MSKPKTRYERIKNWYSKLSEEEKEELKKRNPLLLTAVEFLLELAKGG